MFEPESHCDTRQVTIFYIFFLQEWPVYVYIWNYRYMYIVLGGAVVRLRVQSLWYCVPVWGSCRVRVECKSRARERDFCSGL